MAGCQMQWSTTILCTDNSQTIGAINVLHGLLYSSALDMVATPEDQLPSPVATFQGRSHLHYLIITNTEGGLGDLVTCGDIR